jgi:transglutaminase-like putative cysteine protease
VGREIETRPTAFTMTPLRTIVLSLLVASLAPLAFARAAVRADDAGQFDVRPAPAWADVLHPDLRDQQRNVRSGIDGILDDHQVRVSGANVDEYFRRVLKVRTSAGVQNASEINIDFDPSYERLVIHDVVLIRGGKRIDELTQDEVRIIEKETEADDRIYDGQLTAILFLKDVRAGDVIDYAWSLEGSNPLLGGRYAGEFDFSATVPTRLIRHRVIWPASRPLHTSKPARIEHHGDTDVYVWERRDVAATDTEDATPDWYDPYETLQVSEYGSWSEVAQWADALFRVDEESHAAIVALASEIESAHRGREERIVAAIRFVQDDIRYLGIEMGRGSHEPRQPAVVLSQRYGDCKDKALLLAALLRQLGVQAWPALVNTKLRQRLDSFLPSPFLFDHVITQVADGGKIYWIDGTLSDQGGTLSTIDTPSDERAFIVRPDSTGLTPIQTHTHGTVAVEEVISPAANSASAGANPSHLLDVTSTYSGRNADELRSKLASESLADVAKDHLNRYAADHPHIAALGAPSIDDDRLRNVIVLREKYSIRDLWKNGSWTYYPRAVERHLDRPDTLVRSTPLAIEYPLDVSERLIIRGGASPQIQEHDIVVGSPALHYEQHVTRGRDLIVTTTLHATRDALSVDKVPDHLAALNEMRDRLDITIEPTHAAVTPWAATIAAIVLVGLATSLSIRRRREIVVINATEPTVVTSEERAS